MSEGYRELSRFYDEFMDGAVNYSEVADYYESQFGRSGKIRSVLDLGCGTGTMTSELAKRGYDMTAVDNSPEMLSLASQRKGDLDILYLEQDITSFELYGTVNACISSMDVINHLLSKEDVERCFSLIRNYLDPGGLFIFDVYTLKGFRNIYGSGDSVRENKNDLCCWQSSFDEDTGICSTKITEFCEISEDVYKRTECFEKEKYYSDEEISDLLMKNGLTILHKVYDIGDEGTSNEERAYYTVRSEA